MNFHIIIQNGWILSNNVNELLMDDLYLVEISNSSNFTTLNNETINKMITIKPQQVQSTNYWRSKTDGVIFVKEESHIDVVWGLLCVQDDYWESYKNVIKVAPKEIDNYRDLERYCEYVGKTDIYDIDRLVNQLKTLGIEIIIFQN